MPRRYTVKLTEGREEKILTKPFQETSNPFVDFVFRKHLSVPPVRIVVNIPR